MIDPTTAGTAASPMSPAATTGPGAAGQLDPNETQAFARMMKGNALVASQASHNSPGALHDAAMGYAAQFSGNVNTYDEMRRDMLASIDMKDPIKTMFVMTDHSMQAQMMFAKLHISTGLASAATSLFGTLLKNQQ